MDYVQVTRLFGLTVEGPIITNLQPPTLEPYINVVTK